MINHLRSIYIFSKAVEMGSFRATARTLSLSPSVVSYHISRLEKECSVALFYRSTRRLTLTHEGKRIFDKVFSYQYSVTGSWTEPNVELIIPESDSPADSG